jgi:hypothetical protein
MTSIRASQSLDWKAETADANIGLLARTVCCTPSATIVKNPSLGFGFNNDAVTSITFSFTNRISIQAIFRHIKKYAPQNKISLKYYPK